MAIEALSTDIFWRHALAIVPLAILVALICRILPSRPATRHALWVSVLLMLVVLPLLGKAPRPELRLPDAAFAATVERPDVAPPSFPRTSPSGSARPGPAPRPKSPPALTMPRSVFSGSVSRPVLPRLSGGVWGGIGAVGSPLFVPDTQVAVAPTVRLEPSRVTEPASRLLSALTRPEMAEARPAEPTLALPTRRPAKPQSRSEPAASALGDWQEGLTAVRNAVMSLPPIPVTIWLVGVGAIAGLILFRIAGTYRLVHKARPAAPSTLRLVASASAELGLAHAPETLMMDARSSPMIWCGRRPCMLLPTSLWAQLDDAGRRAVVLHELAHLKRRDHWVCWAEMVIGCVYWWNPVVWWIRGRIREEADLSCDAWVTALMPTGRRAYAQALLDTRKYLSVRLAAAPVVSLGASSMHKKRFARRLTMVMTTPRSKTPRISARGFALVGTLALIGYLVAPVLACPPTPKEPKAPKPPKASQIELLIPTAPEPTYAPSDVSTFGRFMRNRQRTGGDDLQRRLDELEQRLEQMTEQLERAIKEQLGAIQQDVPDAIEQARSVYAAAVQTAREGLARAPRAPRPPRADRDRCSPSRASAAPRCAVSRAQTVLPGGNVVHRYELSEGKLEALTELMVRDDVPILVSPGNGYIEVHATPGHHVVFEAFVKAIGDDTEVVIAYELPEGKLAAITELMVRSDVPILVEPGDTVIRVHGTGLQQAAFDAFVEMIHPRGGQRTAALPGGVYTVPKNLAATYERQAAAHVAQLNQLRAAQRAMYGQARNLENQARQLERQAERLEEEADRLEERAEDLEDEAESLDGRRRDQTMAKVDEMLVRADNLMMQADQMEMQAEQIEDQADSIEEQAENIEDQIEDIEEAVEDAVR